MFKVKSTGFVPLQDVKRGGIAGYPVEKARELLLSGLYIEVEIPNDIETEEVDGPEVAIAPESVDEDNLVEIGDDWQTIHAMKRLALAKQIAKANGEDFKSTGKADEKDAAASKIIQTELDRRNGVITTEERQIIPPAERVEGGDTVITTTVATPVPNIPGQPEIFNPAGTSAEYVIDPATGRPLADNTHGTSPVQYQGENGAEDLEKAKLIAAAGTLPPQNGLTEEEIAKNAADAASSENKDDEGSTDNSANAPLHGTEGATGNGTEGTENLGGNDGGKPDDEANKLPEIPENWQSLHHQTRQKLAKAIKGDFTQADGQSATEAADAVIKAEVQRRAAAEQEDPAK